MIAQTLRGVLRARPRGRRAAARTRSAPRHLGRRRVTAMAVVLATGALLGGGYLWLRDSSLVAVERVSVTGLSGPDAPQIRAALVGAARGMTTLDVQLSTLQAAVSPYPVVKSLAVSTHFPHGMRIAVTEQLPLAEVAIGGQRMPVSVDGTLLRDLPATAGLPMLTLPAAPGGARLQDPSALAELRVLAAAPAGVLARIANVSSGYWHGIVIHLRQGPLIYFGSAERPLAKWEAALTVLSAPGTAGADYIDVTDPDRAAAGTNASVPGYSPADSSSVTGAGTPTP